MDKRFFSKDNYVTLKEIISTFITEKKKIEKEDKEILSLVDDVKKESAHQALVLDTLAEDGIKETKEELVS